jgi:hypothetical protein
MTPASDQPAFDPLRALRTLDGHGVRFVLIGGLGGRLHGSPTVTNETDVCYERSPRNLERLAAALHDLHAELLGVDGEVPFRLDAATLAADDHFTFLTDAGNLDVFGSPAGGEGFPSLARSAIEMQLGGLSVLVASIDDLIAMKRAAGHPKDLVEVEILSAVKDESSRR